MAEPNVEQSILNEISAEEPWKLVETFSKIVRLSGTPEERKAIDYLVGRLEALGIPYTLHEPELYVSLPRWSRLEVLSEGGQELRCKTPAFSASGTVQGELVYIPAGLAAGIGDFFYSSAKDDRTDVSGKIVITEGMSLPKVIKDYEDRGAIGQIYINPDPEIIHELMATTIWGIPTLENVKDKPHTPIVNTNSTIGQRLRALLGKGSVRVRITTKLDEGWRKGAIPVAEIKGTEEPEKFLLLHGHLDSWHYGVTDNATGNAGKLELARVLNRHRDQLRRSIRIAWWSGHSHGRYAGSTWYADNFGLDIERNCIAQVNMDSPGAKWATAYDEMMWMAEVDELCRRAIVDVTGITPRAMRPIRAGDYSFNNIGVTSFYMLSSNVPADLRKEMGFYAVGGSGGISKAWHSEGDVLEYADPENLVRDIKVYAATILRVINADVYPFDFVKTVDESVSIVKGYQDAAGGRFDLQPVLDQLSSLREKLVKLNAVAEKVARSGDKMAARQVNQALLDLGRLLIPTSYAKREIFEHDPAYDVPAFAEIAPARDLPRYDGKVEQGFLKNQLVRGRNKVLLRLRQAERVVEPLLA